MTPDDQKLTEQIARALNRAGWTYEGIHETGDYGECEDCRRAVDPVAAAVLPILRRAQAEASERGEATGFYNTGPRWRNSNPYRTEQTNG